MRGRYSSLAATWIAVLLASSAGADMQLSSIGVIGADSTKKFSGMRQYGVSLSYRVDSASRSFWIPTELDLTTGILERGTDTAAYVSFGPSYRIPIGDAERSSVFVGLGVHPTWISESRFEGSELGGHFHFTSHLGIGAYLDRRRTRSLLLRYQHTSNAGLDVPNPGVDMLALTFRYSFGGEPEELYAESADAE